METKKKKRSEKYENKLHIKGSLDDVLKASTTPAPSKVEKDKK